MPLSGCQKSTGIYTITCFGDSITYGYGASKSSLAYPSLLEKDEEIKKVYNLGICGSTIAHTGDEDNDKNAFVDRYSKISNDTDLVFIFGGTNDYGYPTGGSKLGDILSSDISTFYGAYKTLINGIKDSYPTIKILLATPLQRDDLAPKDQSTTLTNNQGLTLNDYRNAILDIGTLFNLSVVDLYSIPGLQTSDPTFNYFFKDGLHPNDIGNQFLADYLLPLMKKALKA